MTREQEIQARLEAATQNAKFFTDGGYVTQDSIRGIVATLLSELARLTAANAEQAARIAELEAERDALKCHIRDLTGCISCANGPSDYSKYPCHGCNLQSTEWVYRGPRREGEQG